MVEQKNKRRLRSVILVSAVSAIACGGKAQGQGGDGPNTSRTGDGDGDTVVQGTGGYFVGQPVGDWVGEPIGDNPVGVPPDYVGTEPCSSYPYECVGTMPDPGTGGAFTTGGSPAFGGMGGEMPVDEETIGIIR